MTHAYLGSDRPTTRFPVEHYGAVGDGFTDNTGAVQSAIDACSAGGGGIVVLSSGVYLSGTLELKSTVTLHIGEEAILRAVPDPRRFPSLPYMLRDGCSENPVEELKGYALLFMYRAHDVSITGSGTIDGDGEWFQGKEVRPFALRIIGSEAVRVDGLNIRQSAAWSCHVQLSRRVTITNVTIRTSGVRNGDGLDIDSSSDVTVSACDIATSDDALCLKTTSGQPCESITVTGCTLASNCSGVKFGSESVGDFLNIRVSDCTIRDCGVVAIKITPVDGGSVRDVVFSDISIEDSTGPVFVAAGDRGRRYVDETDPGRRSTVADVTFRRIRITCKRYERRDSGETVSDRGQGIVVSGRPDQVISNVRFEEIHTAFWGGVRTMEPAAGDVPVLSDEYPECHKLGILPSYGYYFQYAKNITVHACTDTLINPDVRPLRLDGPGTHDGPVPGPPRTHHLSS